MEILKTSLSLEVHKLRKALALFSAWLFTSRNLQRNSNLMWCYLLNWGPLRFFWGQKGCPLWGCCKLFQFSLVKFGMVSVKFKHCSNIRMNLWTDTKVSCPLRQKSFTAAFFALNTTERDVLPQVSKPNGWSRAPGSHWFQEKFPVKHTATTFVSICMGNPPACSMQRQNAEFGLRTRRKAFSPFVQTPPPVWHLKRIRWVANLQLSVSHLFCWHLRTGEQHEDDLGYQVAVYGKLTWIVVFCSQKYQCNMEMVLAIMNRKFLSQGSRLLVKIVDVDRWKVFTCRNYCFRTGPTSTESLSRSLRLNVWNTAPVCSCFCSARTPKQQKPAIQSRLIRESGILTSLA